jgi:heptosyltransferase-2
VENILVLQTSFLGDTVLSLPVFSALKSGIPNARITLVCSPTAGELLREYPAIDEIIVDDKRGADRGWSGLLHKARELRAKNFSTALSLHKSWRSGLLLFLAGIPRRIGFRQSKAWFLFTRTVERNPALHDVQSNLSILKGLDLSPDPAELTLRITATVEDRVKEKLRSLGLRSGKKIVGINPGSVWPTKRWLPAGFARVIQILQERYDCDVLLFGGPQDGSVVSYVERLAGKRTINLAGKLELRELPAAIGLCSVFITNDSGPMHIAVARGVPTVAIFCATTPSLGFYPYSARAAVLEAKLSCRPCTSHGGKRCPLGTEDCIRMILPEHVVKAAEKLISGQSVTSAKEHPQPEFIAV